MRRAIVLGILAVATYACATPYQPLGTLGGYTDIQLAEGKYRVAFAGNGYTSADTVNLFWLRRCAEITKLNSGRYFVVVDEQPQAAESSYTTPLTCYSTQNGVNCNIPQTYIIKKFGRVGTIRLVEELSAEAFDADMLLHQLVPHEGGDRDLATPAH